MLCLFVSFRKRIENFLWNVPRGDLWEFQRYRPAFPRGVVDDGDTSLSILARELLGDLGAVSLPLNSSPLIFSRVSVRVLRAAWMASLRAERSGSLFLHRFSSFCNIVAVEQNSWQSTPQWCQGRPKLMGEMGLLYFVDASSAQRRGSVPNRLGR